MMSACGSFLGLGGRTEAAELAMTAAFPGGRWRARVTTESCASDASADSEVGAAGVVARGKQAAEYS